MVIFLINKLFKLVVKTIAIPLSLLYIIDSYAKDLATRARIGLDRKTPRRKKRNRNGR